MEAKTTTMFCGEIPHHKGGTYLFHFYPNAFCVRACMDPRRPFPIYEVEVSVSVETPDSYWGWYDAKDDRFEYVYPSRGQVNMCFPYGPQVEENLGRGKVLPVNVKIIRKVDHE